MPELPSAIEGRKSKPHAMSVRFGKRPDQLSIRTWPIPMPQPPAPQIPAAYEGSCGVSCVRLMAELIRWEPPTVEGAPAERGRVTVFGGLGRSRFKKLEAERAIA